jgi:hypothetical protein
MSRSFVPYKILDAKAATGIGQNILVKDFRHLVVAIRTADSANLTVKAVGSIEETAPNFAVAQSVSNMYDFMEMVDLQSGAKVTGDTGISFSGTDDYRLFEVNTNGLQWLNFRVTARSAGSVTVDLMAFNN